MKLPKASPVSSSNCGPLQKKKNSIVTRRHNENSASLETFALKGKQNGQDGQERSPPHRPMRSRQMQKPPGSRRRSFPQVRLGSTHARNSLPTANQPGAACPAEQWCSLQAPGNTAARHRTERSSRAARSPEHRLGGRWGRLRSPQPPDAAPGGDTSRPATRGTGKGQLGPQGAWGTATLPPGGGGRGRSAGTPAPPRDRGGKSRWGSLTKGCAGEGRAGRSSSGAVQRCGATPRSRRTRALPQTMGTAATRIQTRARPPALGGRPRCCACAPARRPARRAGALRGRLRGARWGRGAAGARPPPVPVPRQGAREPGAPAGRVRVVPGAGSASRRVSVQTALFVRFVVYSEKQVKTQPGWRSLCSAESKRRNPRFTYPLLRDRPSLWTALHCEARSYTLEKYRAVAFGKTRKKTKPKQKPTEFCLTTSRVQALSTKPGGGRWAVKDSSAGPLPLAVRFPIPSQSPEAAPAPARHTPAVASRPPQRSELHNTLRSCLKRLRE